MAAPQPTSVPLRIPRFVQRLNAFAASRGVAVDVAVAPYDNDPELRLWSNWRTTREHFLSLGLLTRGQHLPSERGMVSVPGWQCLSHQRALLTGELKSSGDQVCWQIDFGPADFEITEAGDVEIVTNAIETIFHGTAEALVAQGIDRDRLPLAKRPAKARCSDEHPRWWSRRQLDDSIVHRVESQQAFQTRRAGRERLDALIRVSSRVVTQSTEVHPRPTYLRLVVDNDRTKGVTNG